MVAPPGPVTVEVGGSIGYTMTLSWVPSPDAVEYEITPDGPSADVLRTPTTSVTFDLDPNAAINCAERQFSVVAVGESGTRSAASIGRAAAINDPPSAPPDAATVVLNRDAATRGTPPMHTHVINLASGLNMDDGTQAVVSDPDGNQIQEYILAGTSFANDNLNFRLTWPSDDEYARDQIGRTTTGDFAVAWPTRQNPIDLSVQFEAVDVCGARSDAATVSIRSD